MAAAAPNTVFALFAATNPGAVQLAINSSRYPFAMIAQKVSGDSWFLIAPSATTTKEVSDALGITDGTNGSGVIVRVDTYYGRANTAIWEWLSAKRSIELAQPQN